MLEYWYESVVVSLAPIPKSFPDSSRALEKPKVWVAPCVYFLLAVLESDLVKVKVSLASVLLLV